MVIKIKIGRERGELTSTEMGFASPGTRWRRCEAARSVDITDLTSCWCVMARRRVRGGERIVFLSGEAAIGSGRRKGNEQRSRAAASSP
jgi:hypothetical protein